MFGVQVIQLEGPCHAICHFLIKLKRVFSLIVFRNNGPDLFFKTLIKH